MALYPEVQAKAQAEIDAVVQNMCELYWKGMMEQRGWEGMHEAELVVCKRWVRKSGQRSSE